MPPAVIAAGIVAAGTIGGAFIGSNAANAASQAQVNMFQQAQKTQAPFVKFGSGATNELSKLFGFGTGGFSDPKAMEALTQTPGYQFNFTQGQRALEMAGAANHTLTGGGFGREMVQFGSGLASNTFNSTVDQLIKMSQVGSGAAATMGGFQGAQGNAQAAGIIGQANPWISAMNSGPGNALGAYSFFNNPMNGYGGGGGFNPSGYSPTPNIWANGGAPVSQVNPYAR